MSEVFDEKTLKSLNEMGIHALREYARYYGVKAPTTLKKEEIIEQIQKIVSGEIKPNSTNMGRKPKSYISANDCFDDFSGKILSVNAPTYIYNAESTIEKGQIKFHNHVPLIEISEKSGDVYELPFPQNMLSKYNIKKDDILTVKLRPLANSYYKNEIEELLAINDINISEYNVDDFYDLPNRYNYCDTIKINNDKYRDIIKDRQILKGHNYFFYYSDKDSLKKYCYDFCKDLVDTDCEFVILNGNSINVVDSDTHRIQIYSLDINKSYSELSKEIMLVQEKVKNFVTYRRQIVFVINELVDIVRILNYNITGQISDEIVPDTLTAIRRLININKYVNEYQNLTTIIFSSLPKNGQLKDTFTKEILRHSTCEFPKNLKISFY